MRTISLRSGILTCFTLLEVLSVAGCGAEPELDSTPLPEVVTTTQALVSGAETVKTDDIGQAETVSNIDQSNGRTVQVVAYNDQDVPPFVTYSPGSRVVKTWASMMGWSVKVDSGPWIAGTMFPNSSEWPVFWGDPAVAQMPGTPYVYMMNLAVAGAKWPSTGMSTGDMCCIGGAVIARSLNSGEVFFSSYQYITNKVPVASRPGSENGHVYDGSALAGADGQRMYAASQDSDTSKIDVWLATGFGNAFVQLADPFPGKSMESHPRLRSFGPDAYLAATDSTGQLWLNRWSVSNGRWGTPTLVATGLVGGADAPVILRNGQKIANSSATAFAIGFQENNIAGLEARFWYPTMVNGISVLKGSSCNLNANPISCARLPGWTTPSNVNAFKPAVAVALQRIQLSIGAIVRSFWKVSFQTEESMPVGQVTMARGNFDESVSSGAFSYVLSSPGQTPCVSMGSMNRVPFWGDYDDMQVLDNNTFSPQFVRPFTDSTGASCVSWAYKGTPQHISRYLFPLSR
jgi:hypothetical protein